MTKMNREEGQAIDMSKTGPCTPNDLFSLLDTLGIAHETHEHEAVFTVAEAKTTGQRDIMAGGHTKNLFLKDKKDNYYLVVAQEDMAINLKTLHQPLGARSRLSFGKPDAMMALLGVTPGAVSLFGVLNDHEQRVRVFIDSALMQHERIFAHPLTNSATTGIAPCGMIRFLEETGHEPSLLNLAQ